LKERDIVKIVTVMRKERKWERMTNGLSDKSMGNPDIGFGRRSIRLRWGSVSEKLRGVSPPVKLRW